MGSNRVRIRIAVQSLMKASSHNAAMALTVKPSTGATGGLRSPKEVQACSTSPVSAVQVSPAGKPQKVVAQ